MYEWTVRDTLAATSSAPGFEWQSRAEWDSHTSWRERLCGLWTASAALHCRLSSAIICKAPYLRSIEHRSGLICGCLSTRAPSTRPIRQALVGLLSVQLTRVVPTSNLSFPHSCPSPEHPFPRACTHSHPPVPSHADLFARCPWAACQRAGPHCSRCSRQQQLFVLQFFAASCRLVVLVFFRVPLFLEQLCRPALNLRCVHRYAVFRSISAGQQLVHVLVLVLVLLSNLVLPIPVLLLVVLLRVVHRAVQRLHGAE